MNESEAKLADLNETILSLASHPLRVFHIDMISNLHKAVLYPALCTDSRRGGYSVIGSALRLKTRVCRSPDHRTSAPPPHFASCSQRNPTKKLSRRC